MGYAGGVMAVIGILVTLTSYGIKTRGGSKVAHDANHENERAWDPYDPKHKLEPKDIVYKSPDPVQPQVVNHQSPSPYLAQQHAQPVQSMQQSHSGIQESGINGPMIALVGLGLLLIPLLGFCVYLFIGRKKSRQHSLTRAERMV